MLAADSARKMTRVTDQSNKDLQPVVNVREESKTQLPEVDVHARFNYISDLI